MDQELEKVVTVQDNARAIVVADVLYLRLLEDAKDRSKHDAEFVEVPTPHFELKGTTKKSGGVSMTRDFGPRTIAAYEKRYLLIARGRQLATGFVMSHLFFLAPCHMKEWYDIKRHKFEKAQRRHSYVIKLMENNNSPIDWIRETKAELYDGMLLNDPNVSWSYVKYHGIRIPFKTQSFDTAAASRLRELVQSYPIRDPEKIDDSDELYTW